MVDSLNGYMSTSSGLLETTDGWATFTKVLFDFFVLDFDINQGILACSGIDLVENKVGYRVSLNNGNSWNIKNNNIREGHSKIKFYNGDNIVAHGERTNIYISVDDGKTWNSKHVDSSLTGIFDLVVIDSSWIISTSNHHNRNREIYSSIDNGDSWTKRAEYPVNGVLRFTEVDKTIYGVGQKGMFVKSVDKGLSWSIVPNNIEQDIFRLDFISKNTGFVAGGAGATYPTYGVIYRTKDGGQSWDNISPNGIKTAISGIDMINENLGFAVDYNGVIYKTTNGGGPAKTDSVPKYGKDGKLWDGTNGGNPADTTNPTDTSNSGGVNGVSNFINNNLSLEIFPNPTTGKVNIQLVGSAELTNAPVQLVLKDGAGKTVLESTMSSTTKTINLSSYAKGVYYLQLNAENWNTTRKVVRE